jgi:hypothetical protein
MDKYVNVIADDDKKNAKDGSSNMKLKYKYEIASNLVDL